MANTSFRIVGAGKNFLSPTDFIIQVDTSQGAVEIVMPKIATILGSYTTIYQYMGIRFVDISNNASVNNITLTGFETDNINGETNIVLNTNGVGGMLTLIGETDWSYQKNSSSGGGSATPTLQQVLDNNHDLVNGNNFQGTCAGAGNTGNQVIAIGGCSAFTNSGYYVVAIGSKSAYCNTGSRLTTSGTYSAYCNTGGNVTASGYKSSILNTGNNVTASGYRSALCNVGSFVTASGTYSAYLNTGNGVTATGTNSAYNNTRDCVTATGYNSACCNTGTAINAFGFNAGRKNSGNCSTFIGCNAGWNQGSFSGNSLSGMFVVSNSTIPTYADRATALLAITIPLGGVAGNTYFYYNSGTGDIEAVRL